MKSYIAYKNQIQGTKDVSETVKTVEKIAASSVHFLKQEVYNINTYAVEIEKVLARLSIFYKKKDNPLLQKKVRGKKVLVILTGDKGLVGGLWHGVVNAFLENAKHYNEVLSIGIKGEEYLKEEKMQILKSFNNSFDIPEQENIDDVTKYIFDEFKKGAFLQVEILYPQFISLADQTPKIVSFLPFEFKDFKETEEKRVDAGFPIFEPSKRKIFDELLKKYIGIYFHKIIMETRLSELSARTVAMENATTKTDELIKKLVLNYTKDRRRITTQRQLESFTAHKVI